MSKISDTLSKIFTWFFLLFTGFLFLSMLFFNNSTHTIGLVTRLVSFISFLILFTIVAFFLSFIYKQNKVRIFISNYFNFSLGISCCLLLIFQIFYVTQIYTDIGWDCGTLVVTAMQPDMNYGAEYFSIYPNNLFLLFIYRIIIVLFTKLKIANIWLAFSIINIILVDFAILLACLLAKKQWGKKSCFFVLILFVALFGFSPWLMVPYSDTLSMPFVIGSIYLYFLAIRSSKKTSKYILAACIGLTLVIGYFIKPTVLVAGVAILLVQILRLWKSYTLKKTLRQLSFLLVIFVFAGGFFGVYQLYQKNQSMITIEPERAMPATGFFMMGLTTSGSPDAPLYGAWNQDDINILFAAHTSKNMDTVAKDEIAARLSAMSFTGYIQYLLQKARWVTSDGIFYWAGEGNFANWAGNTKTNIAKDFVYPSGKYFQAYRIIMQGIWAAFFFFIILGVILGKKNKGQSILLLLRIAMFGAILFVMLFEGRSRYFINFIPIFAILSGDGLSSLMKTISLKWNKKSSVKNQSHPLL